MRKQMYFTGMGCDKLTENTIAFQISTIRPVIAPQYSYGSDMCERVQIPMSSNPKGLVAISQPYRESFTGRNSHIESMCAALPPKEHYHNVELLGEKLERLLTTSDVMRDLRLVAVIILDGRLYFKLWQPEGFLDVKVLPIEIRGTDYFDFGLQRSLEARDGVRIACMLEDGTWHRFIVEQYHRGRHNEIVAARSINYRQLQGSGDEMPHFNGYMETLTVH